MELVLEELSGETSPPPGGEGKEPSKGATSGPDAWREDAVCFRRGP